MKKGILLAVLKGAIAFGLLYFYYQKGELRLPELFFYLKDFSRWPIPFVLLSLAFLFSAYRWKVILDTIFKESVSFKKVISLYWIGLFLNTFIPGKLGEFSLVYYSRDFGEKFKSSTLTYALFLENLFGLLSLILLSSLLILGCFDEIQSVVVEESYLIPIFTLLVFSLFFSLLFLYSNWFLRMLMKFFRSIGFFRRLVEEFLENDLELNQKFKLSLKGVGLGVINQFLKCLSFYIMFMGLLPEAGLKYFSLLPLGFILTNVISNTGVGVGNAVFGTLFLGFGIEAGAGFYNFYLVNLLFVSLFGMIPFLVTRKKLKKLEQAP